MLYDPLSGNQYSGVGTELFSGSTASYSSFAAFLDTGASGCLLSKTDSEAFGIPLLSGVTYVDAGIGGAETFNVSKSTELRVAPMNSGTYGVLYDSDNPLNLIFIDTTEKPESYTSVGSYNFQVRQKDMLGMYGEDVPFSIIGTPVLNKYVMHVTPSNLSEFSTLYFAYKQAELLPQSAMPDLSSKSGVLRVALKYQNYVTNAGSVSTSTNPTIENVSLTANGTTKSTTFLLDTGSLFTIIGKNMAESLGITPGVGYSTAAGTLSVGGIGSATVTMYPYEIDSLNIPLKDGTTLTFLNPIVYASPDVDLPANLSAILGMNLLGQSYLDTQGTGWTTSPFAEWYVNPFTNELVLVTAVPEPGTLALLAGVMITGILFRVVRRRRDR